MMASDLVVYDDNFYLRTLTRGHMPTTRPTSSFENAVPATLSDRLFNQQPIPQIGNRTSLFETPQEANNRESVPMNQLDIPGELAFIFTKLNEWHLPMVQNVVKVDNVVLRNSDFTLPLDINNYTLYDYVNTYCKNTFPLLHSPAITSPMLNNLNENERNIAIYLNKLLMRCLFDSTLTKQQEIIIANYIVQHALSIDILQDEILLQICNRTLEENASVQHKCWTLMANCLSCAKPSQTFSKYLLKYVSDNAYNGYKFICQHKLLESETSKQNRVYPPCFLESAANENLALMALPAVFVDGCTVLGHIESWSTGEEFVQHLFHCRKVKDDEFGWSVTLRDGCDFYECAGYDYVLDLISQMEIPPGFPYNKSYYLVSTDPLRTPSATRQQAYYRDLPHSADRRRTIELDVEELLNPDTVQQPRQASQDSQTSHNVILSTTSVLNVRYIDNSQKTSRETVPELERQSQTINRKSSIDRNPILASYSKLNARYEFKRDTLRSQPNNGRDEVQTNTLESGVSDMDRWLENVFEQALDGSLLDLNDERTMSNRIMGGGDNAQTQQMAYTQGQRRTILNMPSSYTTPVNLQPNVLNTYSVGHSLSQPYVVPQNLLVPPLMTLQPQTNQVLIAPAQSPSAVTLGTLPQTSPMLSEQLLQQQVLQQQQWEIQRQNASLQTQLETQQLQNQLLQESLQGELLRQQLRQVQDENLHLREPVEAPGPSTQKHTQHSSTYARETHGSSRQAQHATVIAVDGSQSPLIAQISSDSTQHPPSQTHLKTSVRKNDIAPKVIVFQQSSLTAQPQVISDSLSTLSTTTVSSTPSSSNIDLNSSAVTHPTQPVSQSISTHPVNRPPPLPTSLQSIKTNGGPIKTNEGPTRINEGDKNGRDRPIRVGRILWPPPQDPEIKPEVEVGRLEIEENQSVDNPIKRSAEVIRQKINEQIAAGRQPTAERKELPKATPLTNTPSVKSTPLLLPEKVQEPPRSKDSSKLLPKIEESVENNFSINMREKQEALESRLNLVLKSTVPETDVMSAKPNSILQTPPPPPPPPPPPVLHKSDKIIRPVQSVPKPPSPVMDSLVSTHPLQQENKKDGLTELKMVSETTKIVDLTRLKHMQTVLYEEKAAPVFTYSDIPWMLEVRKEIFTPKKKKVPTATLR